MVILPTAYASHISGSVGSFLLLYLWLKLEVFCGNIYISDLYFLNHFYLLTFYTSFSISDIDHVSKFLHMLSSSMIEKEIISSIYRSY